MAGRRPRDRDLWDPGAQPERTYQAWTRTALALAACAVLATRLAPQSVPGAITLSAAGVVAALVVVRVQKARLHRAVIRPAPRGVAAMTLLVVGLALTAAVMLVTGGTGS